MLLYFKRIFLVSENSTEECCLKWSVYRTANTNGQLANQKMPTCTSSERSSDLRSTPDHTAHWPNQRRTRIFSPLGIHLFSPLRENYESVYPFQMQDNSIYLITYFISYMSIYVPCINLSTALLTLAICLIEIQVQAHMTYLCSSL